jgi:hypothetical protein
MAVKVLLLMLCESVLCLWYWATTTPAPEYGGWSIRKGVFLALTLALVVMIVLSLSDTFALLRDVVLSAQQSSSTGSLRYT